MSSVSRPRGPLPPRVYWVRRLLVLSLAVALVLGIGRILGIGSDATDPASATTTAASAGSPTAGPTPGDGTTSAAEVSGAPGGATSDAASGKTRKRRAEATPTPLAAPSGPCVDSDVQVTPTVEETPIAGTDITISLMLTTRTAPACTWEVSSDSVVVKLTSGSDRIWSTQDCPSTIPRQSVVVRKDHPTTVEIVWSGQRSDDECSRTTLWAQPGYYHATAAALGADPGDEQFELLVPPRPTITPTPVLPLETADEGRANRRDDRNRDRGERRRGSAGDD